MDMRCIQLNATVHIHSRSAGVRYGTASKGRGRSRIAVRASAEQASKTATAELSSEQVQQALQRQMKLSEGRLGGVGERIDAKLAEE